MQNPGVHAGSNAFGVGDAPNSQRLRRPATRWCCHPLPAFHCRWGVSSCCNIRRRSPACRLVCSTWVSSGTPGFPTAVRWFPAICVLQFSSQGLRASPVMSMSFSRVTSRCVLYCEGGLIVIVRFSMPGYRIPPSSAGAVARCPCVEIISHTCTVDSMFLLLQL